MGRKKGEGRRKMTEEDFEECALLEAFNVSFFGYNSRLSWMMSEIIKYLMNHESEKKSYSAPVPSSYHIAQKNDWEEDVTEALYYALCDDELFEYGTSPRTMYPTDKAKQLFKDWESKYKNDQ